MKIVILSFLHTAPLMNAREKKTCSCCFSCRGYFETELGTCEPCDELCLTCDGTSTQCLSCREGLHLANGQCQQNCGPMSYAAEDGTCRRCAPHCDMCTNFYTCTSEWLFLLTSCAKSRNSNSQNKHCVTSRGKFNSFSPLCYLVCYLSMCKEVYRSVIGI